MSSSNLNRASQDALRKIPHIGLKRAEALRMRRTGLGAFRSWDDLKQIPGIDPRAIHELQRHFKKLR